MARPRKSPVEQRLTGAGKRRIVATSAPSVAKSAGDYDAPAWMTDRRAVDIWNRMVPELRRLNILRLSDRDTFARYCIHFAGWIKTCEQAPIGKEFTLVKMTNSEERMPRLHPAVRAREIHERHLIDIEDRFGGSPLARFRLIAQQAAHPNAFGDLFQEKSADSAAAPAASSASAPASAIGALAPSTALN